MEKIVSSIQAQKAFAIAHSSDVAFARRYGSRLADSLGFTELASGKLAIVITELATNILKHAREGMMFITPIRHADNNSIQVLALDKGPGISNLAHCMRDGISTSGTAGNGLGAVRRQANEFDVYSDSRNGSAFYASINAKALGPHQQAESEESATHARIQFGSICVPLAGEEECGDAWAITTEEDRITILVADGLGHGPDAAAASRAAVRVLESQARHELPTLLHMMHDALRITRGAALAVGQYCSRSDTLKFVGIGNVSACLVDGETRKQLVSHNGIVGHHMRKVQEFCLPWAEGGIYIMCSDGINTQWDLKPYAGLNARHPALIAGIIYRDFNRVRDDATVVVVKINHPL